MRIGTAFITLAIITGYLGLAGSGFADTARVNPRLKTYGQYSPPMAKKAQANVLKAMQTPTTTLMKRATELNTDYMLNYGLALELGRRPATQDMTPLERSRVQEVFQTLLVLYVRAKDNVRLEGNEQALLDQPDFWILMARSIGFVPRQPDIQVTDSQPGETTLATVHTTDPNTLTGSDGKRYSLTGEPTLNPMLASAAQSCVIYSRVSARMKKVMTIAPASAPHLTSEALKGTKLRAAQVLKEARALGIDACAGQSFYDEVTRYAASNMGKLGTLKDDPSALTAEETAPAPPK